MNVCHEKKKTVGWKLKKNQCTKKNQKEEKRERGKNRVPLRRENIYN